MASRTSSSIGVGITVTLLGIATLALFVTTIVFYSQKTNLDKSLKEAQEGSKDYITEAERGSDAVQQIVSVARGQRKSAMGYLLESQRDIMTRVTGSQRDSAADLIRKIEAIPDSGSTNLLAIVRDRETQIAGLQQRLTDAEAARDRALTDRAAEARRVSAIETQARQTIAAATAEIDRYKDEVDQLRDQINVYKAQSDARVDTIRADAQSREEALQAELTKSQRERVLAVSRIAELEKLAKGQRFTGQSEELLVDGEIIGVDPIDRTVFINRGRRDRLTLGLTFEVYADSSAMRPDAEGNMPPGKASIEVIKIDQDTATARIVRESRGNAIIRGDAIANAVYDPRKTYKFVVFGNFDANRDGRYTPQEAADVRAKILGWRGEVVEELTGDVDFLVLGERPVLPPEPSRTAPIEVVQQYIRLRQIRDRYDELFQRATEAAIPVLNLNRLETLTGGGI